jgi:hypothetical protein
LDHIIYPIAKTQPTSAINLCSNASSLILKFSKVQNLEFRLLINYGALKLDKKIILYLIHTVKGAPIE